MSDRKAAKQWTSEAERAMDLEQAFQLHYPDVFRYLRGLTGSEDLAEELTQETFYRAVKSLKSFRGDCELRVWLCQIGKNLYYESLRKHRKESSLEELAENAEPESPEVPFESLLMDRETALQIHRALHELKEPYKEIFSLRVFGELSFREIAALFEKTEHWACVSYHRAKEMIRKRIEE